MSKTIACPSPQRLKSLAADLPVPEQDDLAAHLDECARCRERLDQFEREEVAVAAAAARNAQSPALSLARQRLAEEPPAFPSNRTGSEQPALRGGDWDDHTWPTLSAELPSGYLQPADDPALLGKIGAYEILERIGNGGMGVVLKARDPRLGRVVAIKVLAPHLAASGAARQRFGREARAAAAVTHEHIVTIHAVEEVSGLPLLVMQYVPGASLRERIDREGPFDVRRVVRIAMQTAAGLAAAHAQGVIHRDIKPGNILLENGIERVRLTDFGLATVSDDVALTQTGMLAGTPQYMSPEQIQGATVDARSDLFSLGSVIYEMCTGRPSFRGSNPYTVLQRVCHEEPRPIHEINPDIPAWLSQIVKRLHEKNPAARFQSAAELVEALRSRLMTLQQPGGSQPEPAPIAGQPSWSLPAAIPRKPSPAEPALAGTRSPVVGLLAAAGAQVFLNAVALVLLLALGFFGISGHALSLQSLGFLGPWLLLGLVAGVVQFVAAALALKSRSARPAQLAALLAALPLGPAWPLGIVFATWTWAALRQQRAHRSIGRFARKAPWASFGVYLPLLAALGAVLLFAMVLLVYGSRAPLPSTVIGRGSKPGGPLDEIRAVVEASRPVAATQIAFPAGPDPLQEIELERAASGAIDFSPDGDLVAIGDRDGFVRVYFVSSGEMAMTLIHSREPVKRVAFSPDGQRLAASRELAIDLWDLSKQKLVRSIEPVAAGEAAGGQHVLEFLTDDQLVVNRGTDLVVERKGDSPAVLANPTNVVSGALAPDGEHFATGDSLGLVKVWKLADLTQVAGFEAGKQPAHVWFLSAELIAVASGRSLTVRNLRNETLANTTLAADLLDEAQPCWLATCGGDLVVRVGVKPQSTERRIPSVVAWRWTDESLAASFEGLAAPPLGMALDPKNQRLAVVSQDRVAVFGLWDLRAVRPIVGDPQETALSFEEETSGSAEPPHSQCADVSSDGRSLVTGHADGSLAWWSLEANTRLARSVMSDRPVRDVQIGPNDSYCLAGDEGGKLALMTQRGQTAWETQTSHIFGDDRKFEVVGVGFNLPYVLYGYQSQKSRNLAGIHAIHILDPRITNWLGSDYEIPCNDLVVGEDGTAWMVDDNALYRTRLRTTNVGSEYSRTENDHSRRWGTTDWLGTVAVTSTGYPLVGTALLPTLTAAQRLEQSQNCSVRLIEPEAGRVLRHFATAPGEVTALAASEWRFVAAAVKLTESNGGPQSRIYIWDAVLGSEVIRWTLDEKIADLEFVPDQRGGQPAGLVAAGGRLRVFRLPLPDDHGHDQGH